MMDKAYYYHIIVLPEDEYEAFLQRYEETADETTRKQPPLVHYRDMDCKLVIAAYNTVDEHPCPGSLLSISVAPYQAAYHMMLPLLEGFALLCGQLEEKFGRAVWSKPNKFVRPGSNPNTLIQRATPTPKEQPISDNEFLDFIKKLEELNPDDFN
jgi:hypothetical protein